MPADEVMSGEDRLLTSAEVAEVFQVSPRTVARWVREEWFTAIRTPGRRLRFRESDVRAAVGGDGDGDRD